MQLDSHLVERFHALHRQHMSGVLQCSGEGFSLGICLLDGEPVAIDIGHELESAFADSCRTYHKLDDAGMAELSAAIAGGAKARDYLVERQLISEAEADQVAQAVVEDALTWAFRGPCSTVDFNQGVTQDQLPIGHSALKMRIGVEALIRTCDQRVGEQQAVEREIGGWESVFALTEAEHVSGQLSEYEKMVLNFIDGRSTVEQIAELCRDSSMNLGRVLRSLIAKRVIHRLDQHRTSGVRPAVTGASGVDKAVRPATGASVPDAAPTASQMEIYRAPRESGSRPIVLIGLIALLVISLGVALLVIQYNRKQERLRKDETEISQLLSARQWQDARKVIGRLRGEAGNDLTAIRTVDGLGSQVESAITAERVAINALIDAEDFAAARTRIAVLPEESELTKKLRDAETDMRASAAALADEVRGRLAVGDIAGALAGIDDASGARAIEADGALMLWRNDTLVIARSQTHPLQVRLAAIARLRQARPDATLQAQLSQLDNDLQGQLKILGERLNLIEASAAAGAWKESEAEIASLRLGDAGAGTEVEARAAQAAEAARRAKEALTNGVDAALLAVANDSNAEVMTAARAKLGVLLQTYPQASGREGIERISGALAALAGSGPRTAAERAAEATALAAQVPTEEPQLAEALTQRAKRLDSIEDEARISLEEARRLGRSGDWKAAVEALDVIIRQPAWRSTAVRREAEAELESARTQAARRIQLKEELRNALMRGDLATCEGIAREIGLAYLPLVVASQPDGADVVAADGKVLGQTPLILDVTADQRVDLQLSVRKPGYQPAAISGSQAEGGWRLSARLERLAAVALELGHPLTARPAVVDGRLWLADRGRVVSLGRPAPDAVQSMTVGAAASLNEPIYAPVTKVGNDFLLATRERVALRLGATVERIPLPVASDRGLLGFHSPLVIDRDLVIVASDDGRMIGAQLGTVTIVWQTRPGASFTGEPRMIGDLILVARKDGQLELIRAEDGVVEGTAALGRTVISSWPTSEGIAGLTDTATWTWDGTKLITEDLPEPAIGGGPGVAVGTFGKVWLRGDGGWSEVGRLDPRPQAGAVITALTWSGHAVVVHGRNLAVFGARPFRIDAGSDLLAPTIWGDALVAASLEGRVWIWKP
jgi:hypothetical protein